MLLTSSTVQLMPFRAKVLGVMASVVDLTVKPANPDTTLVRQKLKSTAQVRSCCTGIQSVFPGQSCTDGRSRGLQTGQTVVGAANLDPHNPSGCACFIQSQGPGRAECHVQVLHATKLFISTDL